MRRVLWIAIVTAGCSSKAHAPAPAPEKTSAAAPAPPVDGWARIEILATPLMLPTGPATELERVLQIADENATSWRDHEIDDRPPTIDAFPHGADAIAGLQAWAKAQGVLPAMARSPAKFAFAVTNASRTGSIAVETAQSSSDLGPPVYLGTLMLASGRDFLEVQAGVHLLARAQRKARSLGADPIPVPDLDLVRTLAAQALHTRRSNDWTRSAEGKREMNATIEAAGSSSLFTKEQIAQLTPDDAEAAAYIAFWLAALDGAQRGEAPSVTLARLQKAVDSAPPSIQGVVGLVAINAEGLQSDIERARNLPY